MTDQPEQFVEEARKPSRILWWIAVAFYWIRHDLAPREVVMWGESRRKVRGLNRVRFWLHRHAPRACAVCGYYQWMFWKSRHGIFRDIEDSEWQRGSLEWNGPERWWTCRCCRISWALRLKYRWAPKRKWTIRYAPQFVQDVAGITGQHPIRVAESLGAEKIVPAAQPPSEGTA